MTDPALKSNIAERQTWQPIETAPKDGTHIIGAIPDDESPFGWFQYILRWEIGHKKAGYWVEAGGEKYQEYSPLYWQPLPPPPESKP